MKVSRRPKFCLLVASGVERSHARHYQFWVEGNEQPKIQLKTRGLLICKAGKFIDDNDAMRCAGYRSLMTAKTVTKSFGAE